MLDTAPAPGPAHASQAIRYHRARHAARELTAELKAELKDEPSRVNARLTDRPVSDIRRSS